ncbi:MAG: nicotinate-nucleotide--dimethylbenzimidazole phosphoribosyltransferase [Clostridiales bacterium]|nr:nicotinate-nucleotide--dimethylbenzimidazole phosphoribosyltransferase [Clostridiales bacterium]
MDFAKLNASIPPRDENAAEAAQRHWDGIAKPLGSLGLLEDMVVSLAGVFGTPDVRLEKRGVIVLCADNGVVKEGVAQSTHEVTLAVAINLTKKQTSVCRMAAVANCDVIPVDMGMVGTYDSPLLLNRRIAAGTKNIAEGPAMSPEEAQRAIQAGIDLVKTCKDEGYKILATGEMGIGNTTTSSAIAAVLLNKPVEEVTGRGSGLTTEALKKKIETIKKAIAINKPDAGDAFDVLHKLGGFDIAGMVGLFLGGALYRIPIVIDGLISAVAALTAVRLCPKARYAMLPSHISSEPAGEALMRELDMSPIIHAQMRLGEGTGAVALLPLLDMALAVYHGSSSFSDIGISAYEKLS